VSGGSAETEASEHQTGEGTLRKMNEHLPFSLKKIKLFSLWLLII
jgi:hypothetical protein